MAQIKAKRVKEGSARKDAKITNADTSQLDLWIENILTADNLETLLGKH